MDKRTSPIHAFWIFTVIVWIFGILFGLFERSGRGVTIDTTILDAVHSISHPIVDGIMEIITRTGDPLFYIIVGLPIVLYLIYKKQYKEALLLFTTVAIASLVNTVLKFSFGRTRPVGYAIIEQGGLSYPSGHAFVGASFYPTLGKLFDEKKGLKLLGKFLTVYGFLMGISRVIMGVHYPTDVFFGSLMGFTFGRSCYYFYEKKRDKDNDIMKKRTSCV